MAGSAVDIKLLLDDKNRELYQSIIKKVPITVEFGNEPCYGTFQQNHKATIYVPHGNFSPSSFAHELLHVYMDSYGIGVASSLKLLSRENPHLCHIISDSLADHICNVLEHQKIYPLFVGLGYDGHDFLADADDPVLTDANIADIKQHLKIRRILRYVYNPSAVDFFIGKYIGAKAACIGMFDYSTKLGELRQIENELCVIMDSLLERWIKYDFTKEGDLSMDSCVEIIGDFTMSLEQWAIAHNL